MLPITLVVIARNEARCIERCLNSFAPHVDRLLVLDTGSTDDTPHRACAAGAQVQAFTWVDDFSAARNAALDAAGPGWHLVADADEWLQSGGDGLRSWCQAHRRGQPPSLGLVTIRNEFDARGHAGVCLAQLPRLLPEAVRYRGRVHEQPCSEAPRTPTGLVLGHDGYRDAQRQRKAGRNERLLRSELECDPQNAYLLYQLGCELGNRQALDQARAAFAQALSQTPESADFRPDLVRRHLSLLQTLKAWSDAAALAERELQAHSGSAYFMLTVGNLFWNWSIDQPEHAAALLPTAQEAWLKALHLSQQFLAVGPGVQMEETGEHAALSLAALHRRWSDESTARDRKPPADQDRFDAREIVTAGTSLRTTVINS